MLYPFNTETFLNPDWLRDNFKRLAQYGILNKINMLQDRTLTEAGGATDIFAEAYTTAAGRQGYVNNTETPAIFDTNKYKLYTGHYIMIEAESVNTSSLSINNCICAKLESGKWVLSCSVGTPEEQRAKLYKTLFYGTNGSDYRIHTSYVTGVTALRTSINEDIGKRAIYASIVSGGTQNNETLTLTGTFNDTTNNGVVSSWSFVTAYKSSGGNNYSYWEIPSGTIKNTIAASGTVDETAIDTSADNITNPATCRLRYQENNYSTTSGQVRVFMLCNSTIDWVSSGGVDGATFTHRDFNVDLSIPSFSEITDKYTTITHNIPTGFFKSNPNSMIFMPKIADWEEGCNIQAKVTNAIEDSGWVDYGDILNYTQFTAEPTKFIVKLVPKTTTPTPGFPSISGVGCDVQ